MMKPKVLFLLIMLSLTSLDANAQKGVRIGYIDTEYILQNVPEYTEASAQLDQKVLKWKNDIEQRLNAIELKKKELDNERVLLTKELYDERLEDIAFEEAEILDYQQKRFGPNGDLMIQKNQLMQPIQDQIYAAVQEIAETKKYDFVFDKASDFLMLYSAERYDISEQVLRTITRASRRKQTTSKEERKALEDEDIVPEVDKSKDARASALEERKAQREAELKKKREAREAAAEARRQQLKEQREAKKKADSIRRQKVIATRNNAKAVQKTVPDSTDEMTSDSTKLSDKKTIKIDSTKTGTKKDSTAIKKQKTAAEILEEKRLKKERERAARQKALEERKKKIIEQRKKARQERENRLKKKDSVSSDKKETPKEGENNN